MIPSSLELNSDDFPFFGDLERTSGSGEKLEKSSFENRDNHHRPKPREMMIRNIARIANLPYGQSQLYLKSAFIKRKALIKKKLKKS